MTAAPPAVAVRINSRVFEAGLTMPAVLRKAGVTRTTWWRVKKGLPFFESTITRIDQAIADLISEAGPPNPGDQAGGENDDGPTRGESTPERSET